MTVSGRDEHGQEYVDMVNSRPVVNMIQDPGIEADAQHPAFRAMVRGLETLSPPARAAWLAALIQEMGDAGAAHVVAGIAAAKRQQGPPSYRRGAVDPAYEEYRQRVGR